MASMVAILNSFGNYLVEVQI